MLVRTIVSNNLNVKILGNKVWPAPTGLSLRYGLLEQLEMGPSRSKDTGNTFQL